MIARSVILMIPVGLAVLVVAGVAMPDGPPEAPTMTEDQAEAYRRGIVLRHAQDATESQGIEGIDWTAATVTRRAGGYVVTVEGQTIELDYLGGDPASAESWGIMSD